MIINPFTPFIIYFFGIIVCVLLIAIIMGANKDISNKAFSEDVDDIYTPIFIFGTAFWPIALIIGFVILLLYLTIIPLTKFTYNSARKMRYGK